MVTSTLPKTYDSHQLFHLHLIRDMMDNITDRQVAVQAFLAGDATHLVAIHEHYAYIAEESARFVYFTRHVPNVTLEDVIQQGHLVLLDVLHRRVCGSNNTGLGEINERSGYEPCLGLRPYLIRSVKPKLVEYIIEANLISMPASIFSKAYIEQYGVKEPPRIQSLEGVNEDGVGYVKQDALPINGQTPEQTAILREAIERLQLDYIETKILDMRHQNYTLEEISQVLGKDKSTISRKLSRIGERWLSVNS